uniref:Uncharacterized protein n=1 Tax=viral metagenome TaxID=1070528 RepID=A0A6C0EA01_9ZZZZ
MSESSNMVSISMAKKALEMAGRVATNSVAVTNMLFSTSNTPESIYIHSNGGTNENIYIYCEKGVYGYGDKDASIQLTSQNGGIGMQLVTLKFDILNVTSCIP